MVQVLKADGSSEPFSEEKLLASVKRAGIPSSLQKQVIIHVKDKLYEGIPTSEVYKYVEEYFITAKDYSSKSKYSLKKGIMDLGPTGFPFEVYVSEILKAEGYSTQVGTILVGKCVSHEVDVIAKKGNEKIMVECKFHNSPGTRSDVQVSLYTKARFEDLRKKHAFTHGMLVTNTKVTSDALSYANCEGLMILSWGYPFEKSLRELIDKHRLYPVTQLSFLSFSQIQELLAHDVVLIKQICENPALLNQITMPKNKREEIMKEALSLCKL